MKSGKSVEFEIVKNKDDWGSQIYNQDVAGKLDIPAIFIDDFSKVPSNLNEKSSFSYLIFPKTTILKNKDIVVYSNYLNLKSQIYFSHNNKVQLHLTYRVYFC